MHKILIYLYIIHLLKSSTCFENYPAHLQVYVVIVYMQPLVSSLSAGDCPVYRWTLSGTICAWQRPPATRPTTFHVWKTRSYQCSFRLLMMGDVSPETCWASYKYGIINFDTLLHIIFSLVSQQQCTVSLLKSSGIYVNLL